MTITAPTNIDTSTDYAEIEVSRATRRQRFKDGRPDVYWTKIHRIRTWHRGRNAGTQHWVTELYGSNHPELLGEYIGESVHAYIGQDR